MRAQKDAQECYARGARYSRLKKTRTKRVFPLLTRILLVHRECAVRAIVDADPALGAVFGTSHNGGVLDIVAAAGAIVGANAARGASISIYDRNAHVISFLEGLIREHNSTKELSYKRFS